MDAKTPIHINGGSFDRKAPVAAPEIEPGRSVGPGVALRWVCVCPGCGSGEIVKVRAEGPFWHWRCKRCAARWKLDKNAGSDRLVSM